MCSVTNERPSEREKVFELEAQPLKMFWDGQIKIKSFCFALAKPILMDRLSAVRRRATNVSEVAKTILGQD